MTKRKYLIIPAFVILLLLVASLRLPVAIAALLLPQSVSLQGASGTLWNGEASALGLNGMVVQQRLNWQFQPAALLGANLVWQVNGEYRDDKSRLQLKAGLSGFEARQISLALPLEPLAGLAEKMKGLKLGGLIQLETDSVSLKSGTKLTGKLENLSSGLTPSANPLGNYRFNLDVPANSAGTWQISTVGGVLKASGQGSADLRANKVDGAIHLQVDEGELLSLKPVLALLPKDDKGYVIDLANMKR